MAHRGAPETRARRRARMATAIDLPPHVWALVLRDATVKEVFNVAHACRSLHDLVFSQPACTCATYPCRLDEPLCGPPTHRSHAFWAHVRAVRPFDLSGSMWCEHLWCGHVAHLLLSLRSGARPEFEYQWAIRWASEQGWVAAVHYLLRDARVDPSTDDQYAIRVAAARRHWAIVECLMRDERVSASGIARLAVAMAQSHGDATAVDRVLGDERVDPSALRQHAIWRACGQGQLAVVDRLLRDERVDPSANEQAALSAACHNGHVAVVERLLRDERVDPSIGIGATLAGVIDGNHVDVLECLLRDERVARDTRMLRQCIPWARRAGRAEMVTLLEHQHRVSFAWLFRT